MRVIQNHEQHIKDIKNSLTREKNRLDYLKRCESGEQKWAAKRVDLVREIGIQLGKITAYEDALEMATAYQTHDEKEKPIEPQKTGSRCHFADIDLNKLAIAKQRLGLD